MSSEIEEGGIEFIGAQRKHSLAMDAFLEEVKPILAILTGKHQARVQEIRGV